MSNFDDGFKHATGNEPFPYQRRFATEGEIPELVDAPTGMGNTAMAVPGWLCAVKCQMNVRESFTDEQEIN